MPHPPQALAVDAQADRGALSSASRAALLGFIGYIPLSAHVLARLVFLAALIGWAGGVVLVLTGDAERGITIGVPAAVVLLAYAWRKAGFWLPDGGGGP